MSNHKAICAAIHLAHTCNHIVVLNIRLGNERRADVARKARQTYMAEARQLRGDATVTLQ